MCRYDILSGNPMSTTGGDPGILYVPIFSTVSSNWYFSTAPGASSQSVITYVSDSYSSSASQSNLLGS